MRTTRWDNRAWASLLVYGVLAGFAFIEQVGRTTTDTRLLLVERPGELLHQAMSLWNPSHNFGELQNQAYGYLFPQGPFFAARRAGSTCRRGSWSGSGRCW